MVKQNKEMLICKACGNTFARGDKDTFLVFADVFDGSKIWWPACCEACAEKLRNAAEERITRRIQSAEQLLSDVLGEAFAPSSKSVGYMDGNAPLWDCRKKKGRAGK